MDKRKITQVIFGLLQNLNFKGLFTGQIYTGQLKHFCTMGMNCYACPLATFACPIGALQASFSNRKFKFPFYVFGFLMLIGILLGRFVCGWICLFGLIQELLYKIPTKKITIPDKIDQHLRYLKYFFLAIFVVIFPIILRNEYGVSFPYFCKFICPIGILEGAIPLMIVSESLRAAAKVLFVWKFGILLIFLILSIFIYRPFCKFVCPLGAFYSFFQKISFLKISIDKNKCVHCKNCINNCKMNVNVLENTNSMECIRCGDCINSCTHKAIKFSIRGK